MSAVIRTDRLAKIFRVGFLARRVVAVEDLTLEIQQGEIFGLLGPNGAGKTTAIKLLLGFVTPTRGEAQVGGQKAGTLEARKKLGYLPENPALYEFLRGDEYLHFAGQLAGLSSRDAKAATVKLLAKVGLTGRADRPIRRFSKGMVQRLALAQALVGDPETVILDEPMSGLDPIGRKDVRDLILDLRKEGRTVLFSTHILSDVEAICDRVGIMVQGKLTDCGAPGELVPAGVRQVEMVLEQATPELREHLTKLGAGLLERDKTLRAVFTDEAQAQEALGQSLRGGAKVVSYTPHRRTLEELFVSRARASAVTS